MKLIAHRGNLTGRDPGHENNPGYIDEALSAGYDVEVDVHLCGNKLFLGHDLPQYCVDPKYLYNRQKRLWCHAKNKEALYFMIEEGLNAFWHTKEDYILTLKGYIWVFPGKDLLPKSIAVMPETEPSYTSEMLQQCYALCSDEVQRYAKEFGTE